MMETSNRQLSNRYNPIQPSSRSGNVWTFQSETTDDTYTTTRDGSKFFCSCPSTGLCKHIIRAILDDASEKFGIVQVWTSEQDAKRQKRRMFKIRANRRLAWVTVGAEIVELSYLVRRGWGNQGWTLHFREDGRDRIERAASVNLVGYVGDGLDYRLAA